MSFNYNYFTKSELVSFLNKHGDDFQYITKPCQIMLEQKMENTMKEIRKTTSENQNLIELLKGDREDAETLLQIQKYDKKWQELHKKYDELIKLAYGE